MKKADLINVLAAQLDESKAKATLIVEALGDIVLEEMRNGGEVPLGNVGRLVATTSRARTGRNPRTGEAIAIPEKTVVKFRASNHLTKSLA